MDQRFCVLAIDDDPDMLRFLETLLGKRGFRVVVALDGQTGLRLAWQTRPDAIVLDIMMPGLDGFDVCRRLRQVTEAPIVFVTARGDTEALEQGLSLGAADYVVKPFRPQELVSRLKASLRRPHADDDRDGKASLFVGDSVMLDCNRQVLVLDGRVVTLTPTEFDVLRLLMAHPGTVFTVNAILARVWGAERMGDPGLVKHYVYQLRQKIEEEPEAPQHLHTVRGRGYYFTA